MDGNKSAFITIKSYLHTIFTNVFSMIHVSPVAFTQGLIQNMIYARRPTGSFIYGTNETAYHPMSYIFFTVYLHWPLELYFYFTKYLIKRASWRKNNQDLKWLTDIILELWTSRCYPLLNTWPEVLCSSRVNDHLIAAWNVRCHDIQRSAQHLTAIFCWNLDRFATFHWT